MRARTIMAAAALSLAACRPNLLALPNHSNMTPSETPAPTSTPKNSRPQTQVPQAILGPILNEASKLSNVPVRQLVIVRAEPVVWNDGSLGCPEPGMEYTQTLVNGYWVVIEAAGQTYDFRVGPSGSFRLCPAGRGQPPLPSDAT